MKNYGTIYKFDMYLKSRSDVPTEFVRALDPEPKVQYLMQINLDWDMELNLSKFDVVCLTSPRPVGHKIRQLSKAMIFFPEGPKKFPDPLAYSLPTVNSFRNFFCLSELIGEVKLTRFSFNTETRSIKSYWSEDIGYQGWIPTDHNTTAIGQYLVAQRYWVSTGGIGTLVYEPHEIIETLDNGKREVCGQGVFGLISA